MRDELRDWQPLGWTWNGRVFLFGEGEVTIERFNEVVGGTAPNGVTYEFSIVEDDDEAV